MYVRGFLDSTLIYRRMKLQTQKNVVLYFGPSNCNMCSITPQVSILLRIALYHDKNPIQILLTPAASTFVKLSLIF